VATKPGNVRAHCQPLGISSWKDELEDLAFKVVLPGRLRKKLKTPDGGICSAGGTNIKETQSA